MLWYNFTISHVPGKQLTIADALSRSPTGKPEHTDLEFQHDTAAFLSQVTSVLPATERKQDEIRYGQEGDPVCQKVARYSLEGWPDKRELCGKVRHYYPV